MEFFLHLGFTHWTLFNWFFLQCCGKGWIPYLCKSPSSIDSLFFVTPSALKFIVSIPTQKHWGFSYLKIDCKTYYFVFFKLENIAAPIFCCYSNDQDVWSKIRFTLSISQINLATAVKYFKLENEMNGQIILNLLWNVLIQYWFKNPKTSSLKFLHP
jgi:hypothetical protein